MIKHLILHTATALLITTTGFAQCPSDFLALYSQTDVDAFFANYPNCTQFDGNVRIDQTNPDDPITDLTPLSGLESISGYLQISRMGTDDIPTPLDGLENLNEVGGLLIGTPTDFDPQIIPMASLAPLSGIGGLVDFLEIRNIASTTLETNFDNITTIDRMRIHNCPNLETLPTFPALTLVRTLEYSNLSLTEIAIPPSITEMDLIYPWQTPFIDLASIGISYNPNLLSVHSAGTFPSCSQISFTQNPLLQSITGFESLEQITTALYIHGDHPAIFDSFHNVHTINAAGFIYNSTADSVEITLGLGQNQPELQFELFDGGFGLSIDFDNTTAIHFPANLTSIGGGLNIQSGATTTVTGFENLDYIGGFLIFYLPSMEEFPDFTSLLYIGGDFNPNYNMTIPGISDFTGFDNLQHIGGDFSIGYGAGINSSLVSLNGLQNLQSVGSDLYIGTAPLLSDISAITGLQSVGLNFELYGLPTLNTEDLVFEELSDINGLRFNSLQVTSLPEFPSIQSMSALIVQNNYNLLSLSGLPALHNLTYLTITNNDTLTEIICNPEIQLHQLILENNPHLDNCATPCICALITTANTINIANNGENCSSPPELESTCTLLSTADAAPLQNIQIYLNSSNTLHIHSDNTNLTGHLRIHDLTGRLIHTHHNTQPESFTLPFPAVSGGIYLVSLTTPHGQKTEKIFIDE